MARKSVLAAVIGLSLAVTMVSSTLAVGLWLKPGTFDPERSGIVKAVWVPNQGVSDDGGTHAGLLLSKNGPSSTNASAGASIFGSNGLALNEFGWDVRDDGYCGDNSPRFYVVTMDNVSHDVGCSSSSLSASHRFTDDQGVDWKRLRYDPRDASPPIYRGQQVKIIGIIFDAGTDQGEGFVYLDNIEINDTSVANSPRGR